MGIREARPVQEMQHVLDTADPVALLAVRTKYQDVGDEARAAFSTIIEFLRDKGLTIGKVADLVLYNALVSYSSAMDVKEESREP